MDIYNRNTVMGSLHQGYEEENMTGMVFLGTPVIRGFIDVASPQGLDGEKSANSAEK